MLALVGAATLVARHMWRNHPSSAAEAGRRSGHAVASLHAMIISGAHRQNEAEIAELSTAPEGSQPLHFDTVYARSKLTQFRVCLWRNNITWWRSPQYNFTRMLFTTLIGALVPLVTLCTPGGWIYFCMHLCSASH